MTEEDKKPETAPQPEKPPPMKVDIGGKLITEGAVPPKATTAVIPEVKRDSADNGD